MKMRSINLRRIALLVLLLLCMGAWVRSLWVADAVHWSDKRRFVDLTSSRGRINFTNTLWPNDTAWPTGWRFDSHARSATHPHWETMAGSLGRKRCAGFEWSEAIWSGDESMLMHSFFLPHYQLIAIPYWAIGAALCLPLARDGLVARRRRRRIAANRCPDCGYDLRMSPDRCPECGLIMKDKHQLISPALTTTS